MTPRPLVVLLFLCLVAWDTIPVEAQFPSSRRARRNQSRFPDFDVVDPNHETAKTNAEQAHQHGNFQRAVDLTTNVLSENPNDHVALYLRASARVELGMQKEDGKLVRDGIGDARQAIGLKRTGNVMYYLPYLYGMSRLTELEGKPEHAQVALQVADQVLQLSSLEREDKANIYYQRAFANVRLHEYAAAAADYERALGEEPKHLGALLGLAEAYVAAQNHEQALASFNRAVEALPDYPLVHNNRGMYLQEQGDLKGAIADFSRAAELNDRYFWALTNRGVARIMLGESAAAEADFTQSLTIQPNQPAVHVMRGSARLAQGKVNQARQDFVRAIELDREDAEAHANLGFTKYFAREFEGADSSFQEALRLAPDMHHLNPWRYVTLVWMGKEDEAKTLFAERLGKTAEER
jgi:tetratricopeptide (TPR) repeat protein